MWKCATVEMRRKICCFHYGERSDVQRQQQYVTSHRTAEESRTSPSYSRPLFSSPDHDTKGQISYCHSLAFIVCKLILLTSSVKPLGTQPILTKLVQRGQMVLFKN